MLVLRVVVGFVLVLWLDTNGLASVCFQDSSFFHRRDLIESSVLEFDQLLVLPGSDHGLGLFVMWGLVTL